MTGDMKSRNNKDVCACVCNWAGHGKAEYQPCRVAETEMERVRVAGDVTGESTDQTL